MRVLYVMGMGRSGSTLLDILLASHPNVVGTGELAALQRAVSSADERCACGIRASACPFWCAIRERWAMELGSDQSIEYAGLQAQVERSGRLPWLGQRSGGASVASRYGVLTAGLVRAIHEISGKGVLVDSSKNPARAWALSQINEIDLFVVHLVRDGRAVAWSYGKRFAKDPAAGIQVEQAGFPPWRSALRWDLVNAQSDWVRRQIPRKQSILLRYEDLIKDPRLTLQRIGGLVDLDLSGVADSLAAGEHLRVGHPIAGNRLRMEGAIRLRRDDVWLKMMSPIDRASVSALTLPWMRQYGYE